MTRRGDIIDWRAVHQQMQRLSNFAPIPYYANYIPLRFINWICYHWSLLKSRCSAPHDIIEPVKLVRLPHEIPQGGLIAWAGNQSTTFAADTTINGELREVNDGMNIPQTWSYSIRFSIECAEPCTIQPGGIIYVDMSLSKPLYATGTAAQHFGPDRQKGWFTIVSPIPLSIGTNRFDVTFQYERLSGYVGQTPKVQILFMIALDNPGYISTNRAVATTAVRQWQCNPSMVRFFDDMTGEQIALHNFRFGTSTMQRIAVAEFTNIPSPRTLSTAAATYSSVEPLANWFAPLQVDVLQPLTGLPTPYPPDKNGVTRYAGAVDAPLPQRGLTMISASSYYRAPSWPVLQWDENDTIPKTLRDIWQPSYNFYLNAFDGLVGGIINGFTVSRAAQKSGRYFKVPKASNPLPVSIGCNRSGQFVEIATITIPANSGSVTIDDLIPVIDPIPLYWKCSEPVDVQAWFNAPVSRQFNYITSMPRNIGFDRRTLERLQLIAN